MPKVIIRVCSLACLLAQAENNCVVQLHTVYVGQPVYELDTGKQGTGQGAQYETSYYWQDDHWVEDTVKRSYCTRTITGDSSLPDGLVDTVVEHVYESLPGAPPYTPYTIQLETWDRYGISGTVCAVSSPLLTYHAIADYNQWNSYAWRDEWTYGFRTDDYAGTPDKTNYLGHLTVQTTWSTDNGWVEGSLHAEERWQDVTVPTDVDVFRIDAGAGVYCVETDKKYIDVLGGPLDISVFKKKKDESAYDGDAIAWTNVYNVYDVSGNNSRTYQRLYFTLDNNYGAYLALRACQPNRDGEYRIRVFRARPVILVHGIDSKPWTQEEAQEGNNSMGNWEDCLPWDISAYPCVCYNFAWDSREGKDELREDGAGKIAGIVRPDPGEAQNPYVEKLYRGHGLPVVLIGHSMGGFIVRYALSDDDSRSKIHRAVLLGSPMYGSDIALGPVRWPIPWWKNTSEHNLKMLRRGSTFTVTMNAWAGGEKCLCIAGDGAPPRARIPLMPYERGLGRSDGVVPVSSALLQNALNNIIMKRDHGTVGLATYVKDHEYPFNPAPAFPGWNFADPCERRRDASNMFRDPLYIAVRDFIE